MASLVDGDAAPLLLGRDLVLLLQPPDYTVDSVHEVLAGDKFLLCTGGDQGGLVTYIGYISPREARGTPSQQVDIYRVVDLQWT